MPVAEQWEGIMDIMDYIVDQARANEHARRITVPSRVKAKLSQLESSEQATICETFESIERNGLDDIPGVDVRRLATSAPRYVLSLDNAPDVWIYVRATQNDTIEVTDIARPETVRSLFHSQQNGS